MGVERPAIRDGETLGSHRLDAEIIGARSDGALDLGAQQILEHAEQRVLQIDGQREEPIEKGGDRRQVFSDAGGTGRSYQSDLTAKNRRLRVHYLLEAGWEAGTAIQGLGQPDRTTPAQP